MIKISTLFILLMAFFCESQELDSLKILTGKDWKISHWFENDSICFLPKEKPDTNFRGLSEAKILKKKKKNLFGEKIRFRKNGTILYRNNVFCPVGESKKRAHSYKLDINLITIDFETTKWPWRENKVVREKKTFRIVEWNNNKLKIIKCQ
ncbi:hypothetical protein [uncultured Tenacibaculum sp.]|uniref:hypothetical protein n=1 Tax=uncultured Tenacibaculum sp. TaxID=174713 RepID=UPI00262D2DC9|nr:hypothetical protein [uncultured Tenacibaculum sp.]